MEYTITTCEECKLKFYDEYRLSCVLTGSEIHDLGSNKPWSAITLPTRRLADCPFDKDPTLTFQLETPKKKGEWIPKNQREKQLKFVMDAIEPMFKHCDWFEKYGKGRINIYEVVRKLYKEYPKMNPLYFLATMEYLTWNDQDPNYFNMVGIIKSEDFHGAIDKIESMVKRYHQEMFKALGLSNEG